jgi:hypothetical protein
VPALPPAPQAVVLAFGLLAAVGFLLVALARHHVASGLVAGSVLAVPPTSLLIAYAYGTHQSAGSLAVLVAVPVVAAVAAAVALFVPAARRLLRSALPPHLRAARPVVGASALRAVIGVAIAVLTQSVPLLGHAYTAQGVIMAVLLAVAIGLAWWVPSTPGAILAGVVLVELGLDAPWWRIAGTSAVGDPGLVILSVVGLLVTAGVAALLVWRHRWPGVVAAAAYALAGALATLVAAAIGHRGGDLAGVAWYIGPLVLLAVPAAYYALRGHGKRLVAGQAVGCVVLVGGAFALARLLLPVTQTSGIVADIGLAPLIPTFTDISGGLPGSAAAPLAALLMFLVAVPLLVSTIRRPSPALAGSGVLVLVEAAAAALLGIAENWAGSSVNTLIAAVLVIGAVVGVAAILLLRRQDVSTPTAP